MQKDDVKQEDGGTATPTPTTEQGGGVKTFTQEEVNEIISERLKRERENNLKRYNVSNDDELNSTLAKGREYDDLKKKNGELTERVLFLTHAISAEREDDVRTYFKGKSLEMNEDNLAKALETHKEWVKENSAPNVIPTGAYKEPGEKKEVDDDEMIRKIFGINRVVHKKNVF